MGKSTVFANGQGISSTNSGAVTVSSPDVCLTPAGCSLVPVPYSNTAHSSTLAGGTKTVTIDGGMGTIDGCCYSKSIGDEAGRGKGVVSGTVGDKAEFINSSFDVKIEGRGACRNSDAMTHNNNNALGMNQDSADTPEEDESEQPSEKTTFRFRVVEHLSWDDYDNVQRSFRLGHKDNKAMAGMKFKIRMSDGTEVEETTDEDGVIELTGQNPLTDYEIIFIPPTAKANNKYHLFYNRCTPLEKTL
jgi:hypothetical protein